MTRVGWDPKESGPSSTVSSAASLRMGGQRTGDNCPLPTRPSPVSAMDPEILDQKGARAVAEADVSRPASSSLSPGSATGNPALRPGRQRVEIEGIGDRFSALLRDRAQGYVYTQQDGYTASISLREGRRRTRGGSNARHEGDP